MGYLSLELTDGGVLLFIYRHTIGNFTGYYLGLGKIVDKPTPEFLLTPFTVVFIGGGVFILLKDLYQMITNK